MKASGYTSIGTFVLVVALGVGRATMRANMHARHAARNAETSADHDAIDVAHDGASSYGGRDGLSHLDKAKVLLNSERFAESLKHLDRAIELDPKLDEAYGHRSYAHSMLGNHQKAYDDLTTFLTRHPDDHDARFDRGWELEQLGRYVDAIADYEAVLRANPEDDPALNNLAWVLATAPVDEVRDGQRAFDLARRAVELSGGDDWGYAGTLAAAAAELGRYEVAVKVQAMAIELAPRPEQGELYKQLSLFHSRQPYRMPAVEQEEKK